MHKILRNKLNRWQDQLFFPGLALGVCILAFALQLNQLGFYLDDWLILAAYRMEGLHGLMEYSFLGNRPLVFWLWYIGFKILGSSPLAWQIWALLWRWLSAVVLWKVLDSLWPESRRETVLAGLLFLVYPVFHQQPTALTYSFHWICFTLFGLSLYLMGRAAKEPCRYLPLSAAAILAGSAQLFSQEFFVGLELLRPLVLWLVLSRVSLTWRQRLHKTLLHWLPYLLVLIAFIVWRLLLMPNPGLDRNTPTVLGDLLQRPLSTIPGQASLMLQDLVEAVVSAWYKTFQPEIFALNPASNLAALAVAAAVVIILTIVFRKNLNTENAAEGPSGATRIEMLVFGLAAVVMGLAPGWTINKHIVDTASEFNDRFGLAAMWGAGLLVVVLAAYFIQATRLRTVVLCLFVGLAAAQQVRNAAPYRWSWEDQGRFYWQLHWRVPDLEPPTALLGEGALFLYMGSWANISAINLMYQRLENPQQVNAWYFDLYRYDLTSNVENRTPLLDSKNLLEFSAPAHNSLAIQYKPEQNQCLWLVNSDDYYNPYLGARLKAVLPLSTFERILPQSSRQPPVEIFGSEPAYTWCYFFQKIQLASQAGDRDKALSLWAEAGQKGLRPASEPEYVPVIKAAAFTGRWDLAVELTLKAYYPKYVMHDYLCTAWGRILSASADPERQAALQRVNSELDCRGIINN